MCFLCGINCTFQFSLHELQVPCLRRLVAGLSSRGPGFESSPRSSVLPCQYFCTKARHSPPSQYSYYQQDKRATSVRRWQDNASDSEVRWRLMLQRTTNRVTTTLQCKYVLLVVLWFTFLQSSLKINSDPSERQEQKIRSFILRIGCDVMLL